MKYAVDPTRSAKKDVLDLDNATYERTEQAIFRVKHRREAYRK